MGFGFEDLVFGIAFYLLGAGIAGLGFSGFWWVLGFWTVSGLV